MLAATLRFLTFTMLRASEGPGARELEAAVSLVFGAFSLINRVSVDVLPDLPLYALQ